jgi:hypothetical protein
MYEYLLYGCIFFVLITFFLCLYACARVGKLIRVAQSLDWEQLALLTGEVASVKRSIMNLSNRVNGMNKGSLIKDLELIQEKEVQKEILNNGKLMGG